MRDADIEQRQLENTGNLIARLRRKGICLHGWVKMPQVGECECLQCGKKWPSAAECDEERQELKIQYL